MAVTNFTPLLGLALPTTGDLDGSWGDTVNAAITGLLDAAVAGVAEITSDADVTLTTTNGAANQARSAILRCTGARTAVRTLTAPAQSKTYVVVNDTTGGFGVKLVGTGPTTGVTVAAGAAALIVWTGADFIVVATNSGVGSFAQLNVAQTWTAQQTFGELKEGTYTLASSGTVSLDPANGSLQKSTLSGDVVFTESLEAGQSVLLMLANGVSHAVTWPTMTWVTTTGNAAPTLTAADTVSLWKFGTTLYGAYVGSYA